MFKRLMLLVACAGLPALAGCGSSSTTACGPATCAGCCDTAGKCQLPTDDHCGANGMACVACTSPKVCDQTACVAPTGASGGSAGSTTAASSSTGGTSSGSASTGSSGASTGSHGSTGASSTSTTTGTTAGSSSSTTTTTSTGTSTGGSCCLALGCSQGCDPVNCVCLSGTGGSTGGVDAGAICQSQSCVIYAESARTLYQVDPNPPNALTQLCDFNGDIHPDAGVNDIAVQRNGALYGITKTDLFLINPQTCAGTQITGLVQSAGGFNCLTFTDQDTLLAADATGTVVSIDVSTGTVTPAGHFGGGMGCSGDIVALADGTIFATAKILDGGSNASDVLVTLDSSNGFAATRVSSSSTGYHGIFGLGYWAGTFFGFDKTGNVLAIDPVTGVATLVRTEPNTSFFGAGVTPLAPVIVK